ncbi:putative DNA-binding domain-containing protein [Sphingorhabdus sp. Alg239-R122]|uniref:HvfC/BufC family peptide modification chaperone n=1 Tax=Sphingorhabdus sp. Alg239-R122 TaxID=2305989 RepID=UPI0013DA769B|nr:putative DNA-binding domain-containing protein [Sphingorhabdus sp. Alg239-R122]
MADHGGYSLGEGQDYFLDTLHNGPGHCPEDLFAGSSSRAIMGLKAHANTVSHARLVAMEETYPRTMQRLDALNEEGFFNAICRDFIEREDVKTQAMMDIGHGFADYLAMLECDAASIDLAAIEMRWLESYHAADASPLTMQHIAALEEEALMALPLCIHPSLRVTQLTALPAEELTELVEYHDAAAVATLRPEAQVFYHPWPAETAALVAFAQGHDEKNIAMCNLLEKAVELVGEDNVQPLVFTVVEAGVFIAPGNLQA